MNCSALLAGCPLFTTLILIDDFFHLPNDDSERVWKRYGVFTYQFTVGIFGEFVSFSWEILPMGNLPAEPRYWQCINGPVANVKPQQLQPICRTRCFDVFPPKIPEKLSATEGGWKPPSLSLKNPLRPTFPGGGGGKRGELKGGK